MSLERSLQETGAGLISVRANERKKNAESLKSYLTGNAAPCLLSNNTLKKKGHNWNNVFDDINEYILKELEKHESSKTFFSSTAPLCTTLLHSCVSGSNKGRAFISCEKLVEACMYVLKDKRMATAIGDAYLNLLYKHVLPYDYYVSFITPAVWEDLLDVCIDASLMKHTKLDNFTLLRLIWLVIKKGKSCCQFVIPLRNALPRLKTCFHRAESDKKIQEIVTEITTLLLEMLAPESRLTVCEFTESVLPVLLKCYDQNADHKKKSSVFKLLHLTIALHHPEGKLQNEEGSMANNWDVWNKYLFSIMEIVCLEVNYLQKLRKHNEQSVKQCTDFYRLAASVYFQTFNLPTDGDTEALNSSKRQRVSMNNYKSFPDLIEELRLNHMPWLGINYMYLHDYGSSVNMQEFMAVLSVAESFVSNNTSNFSWHIFEQMTCFVLKSIIKTRDNNKEEVIKSLTTLWNSCVRNSSSDNDAHKSLHKIMQCLLELDILDYPTVQPLIKLYFEKGIPVTDASIRTLCNIYHKFYDKCNCMPERKKCFDWFAHGNVGALSVEVVKDLLLRLMANNNVNKRDPVKESHDELYESLLNSTEKCILFSEGVIGLPKKTEIPQCDDAPVELNNEIADMVQKYLQEKLTVNIDKLDRIEIPLIQFVQELRVVITYVDIVLQISTVRRFHIEENELYITLKKGLSMMCNALAGTLKEIKDDRVKLTLLQCIEELWFTDFDPIMDALVRSCADQEFFSKINEILSADVSKENEEVVYEENDSEYNPSATRQSCITLLAVYCRKDSEYREDILELILDPALYDFTSVWDIKCAFRCIKILHDRNITECPLASIFTLLSNMCRGLFRNTDATESILEILLDLLKRVWAHDVNMRKNCIIMVKSYLQRCEHLYYPPQVAALIYKCVAKIRRLNLMNDVDCPFKDSLRDKISGNIFSLRLYAGYLLNSFPDCEIDFLNSLVDIFVIDVPNTNQYILKDETRNRTLTVLHCFLAFAQSKSSAIREIINRLLEVQKDKSLDVVLVKKFLDKITITITSNDIETYLQKNILSVVNFWVSKQYKLEELPLYLFGFQNMNTFLEKNMKWLISADILWLNEGNVRKSKVLSLMKSLKGGLEESIIEQCFSNIIMLCFPYIVTEKYNLSFSGIQNSTDFKQSIKNGVKMFQMTRQILNSEKWSVLFVENMAELLLMAALHLRDQKEAEELFQVDIPNMTESYIYPKIVFNSILKYFGELIDGNIMQYLCTDQAITIFDILIKLWETYLRERVFEYRVLTLYSFVTFAECVPLGFDSDAFVCDFTCSSLAHAIKKCTSKEELRILVQALSIILTRFSPGANALTRKSILKARAVLLIKKDEGYRDECEALLNNINNHLDGCEDVVDFGAASLETDMTCSTKGEFSERLKAYNASLICPSHETLIHLRQFVKCNKHYVNSLCEELNTKRFSEECKTSIIHQIIFALSNILKSSSDYKITIEACNCLSEIGTYDLKTIVTVPPPDTDKVVHLPPKQSFAFAAVAALSDALSDEDPAVINKAVIALSDIFKYREGKDALELAGVNVQLLKPLLSPNSNDETEFQINKTAENQPDCWVPREIEDHERWLTRITTTLMDIMASNRLSATNYLKSLRDICLIKLNISRQILPSLVGLLLYFSPETFLNTFSDQINNFFKYIWKMNFDDELDSSGTRYDHKMNVIDHDHKMIIQYMLDVVNFVRLQRAHYKTRRDRTPLDSHNYLRLDYDKVAWAASMAGQNLVAIFYGELWAVARNGGVPPSSPELTTNLAGGDNVQRIFRKCFVSIGEMDAIEGCGTAHLTSESEIRKHLINTGQYTDALLSHDIALSAPGPADDLRYGVVRSLHKSGLYHLALQYIQSLPESDQMNDVKYDCLTGLGDWTTFVDTQNLEEKSKTTKNPLSIIKAFRYACLKDCFNLQTGQELTLPLNRAKLAVSRWCHKLNMENCQSVYKVVANVHMLTDIENYFLVRCDKLPITALLNNWKVENLPPFHDFKHLEPLISQRSLILEHAGKTNKNILKDIVPLQLQYVELGLSNDRVQMAQRLVSIAKNMEHSDSVSLAEGQVAWAKGHKEIALSLVRNVMGNRSANVELTAASLRQYGMWMAESKCENPRDIINTFLKKSLDVLGKSDHMQTRLKVYYDIAKFADSEYKQVVSYMNSSIFEHKLKCMESMKGTADSMKSTQPSLLSKDERKVLATTKGLYTLDEAEIANTKAEKLRFLHLAMRYYLLSLRYSEENNLSVFRVISLWLANPALTLDGAGEGGGFEELLHAIPSRKFLAVLPQLAPRLAPDDTPFARNLTTILKRCAQEHPHHTLPILFSLKNSDKDRCILNAARGVGSARALEPREATAAALVATLATRSPALAAVIAQMERLCDATISFANFKTQLKEQKQKIPSAELIHRLGPLDAIPVPIDTIPVRSDCNYSTIPSIVSFENYFELVGGINCPKKINCRSSDGRRRIVLVKGEDDLRQDAVMQQVFNIVNTLLEKNPVTSRNKLLIRTYKVVPMSRQSGVLEWCEGTLPLGDYLVGRSNNGAHARYRPQVRQGVILTTSGRSNLMRNPPGSPPVMPDKLYSDISCTAARTKFTSAARKPQSEKMRIFLEILTDFKPVFHNFFTEHYLDPVTWYERRLAYTKSVATSSMVGYILGLGDRHVQNILVDKKTAEVVHIDFGIAFDQGRALPTPETIPFRLTQDMIAGFGSSGVEGIFRKSCEKTMHLLRDNQETLLTILEVLLCDPFYSWTSKKITATPKDANVNVGGPTGSVADLAERTLLAVGSKLSGTEAGAAGGVAVPGQVARLLRSATDPANLCRLFQGWQPYL